MLLPPGDAIDALNGEIAGILPAPVPPLPAPQVAVHALCARLPGVGGFVGLHDAPLAEVRARLLDAEVTVRVMAASRAGLLEAEARAARDIVATDPALLRRRGVLRIARIADPAAPFARDLRFAVRCEHRPLPTESEGRIGAVSQDVALGTVTGGGGSSMRPSSGWIRWTTSMPSPAPAPAATAPGPMTQGRRS